MLFLTILHYISEVNIVFLVGYIYLTDLVTSDITDGDLETSHKCIKYIVIQ